MSVKVPLFETQVEFIEYRSRVYELVSHLQAVHGRLVSLTDVLSLAEEGNYNLACVAELYKPFLGDIEDLLNELDNLPLECHGPL
jgi:hypothetical protein